MMLSNLNLALTAPRTAAGGGGGGEAPAFFASAEYLNDVTYNVVVPAAKAVSLPTNGNVLRIVGNGSEVDCDPTKVTVTVRRKHWNLDGTAAADQLHVIYGVGRMEGPYNEASTKRPAPGSFDISMSEDIYKGGQVDRLGRTHDDVVELISFAAGFIAGSAIGFYTGSVTRSDNLPYPNPIARNMSRPGRINDGTLTYEFGVVHQHARNGTQLACVQAWAVSGGVDGVGGTTGPVGISSVMEVSEYTPSGGPTAQMGQLALRVPCYRVPVSVTGLSDTASAVNPVDGVVADFTPHFGPNWTTLTMGDAWSGGGKITPNLPKCLPMFINTGGKYSRRYVWINANRTAGGAPAVQTTTTDPGTAGSYGFMRTALVAAIAVNVARGHEAGSMTGIELMLRDISGSVRGANDNGAGAAGAYTAGGTSIWNDRNLFKGFLTVRRANGGSGYSQLCRLRGVNELGVAIGGRSVAPKIHWADIDFDSTGTNDTPYNVSTNANPANVIFDGGGNDTTNATFETAVIHSFERCRIEDNSVTVANASSTKCLLSLGHVYEYLVEERTAIAGQGHSRLNGIVVSVGSFHDVQNLTTKPRQNAHVAPTGLFGSWYFGGGISSQDNSFPLLPPVRGTVVVHCRFDFERFSFSVWSQTAGRGRPNDLGQGLCGVLFRRSTAGLDAGDPWAGPLIFSGGDGSRAPSFKNHVRQHVSTACKGIPGGGRDNGPYNDAGAVQIIKEMIYQNCAMQSIAMKNGFYNDTTSPQSANEGAHSSATTYYQGDTVHDGNATASLRVYHGCKQDALGGTGILTSNTAYWEPCATATPTTAYGWRSLRTGNNKARRGVNFKNNAVGQFGATPGEQAIGLNGWKVDFTPFRTVGIWGEADSDNFFNNDTSGPTGTFTDAGDYRAKPSGPLVAAVPAGDAVVPFDAYGVTRPNDGTGALGFAEAA